MGKCYALLGLLALGLGLGSCVRKDYDLSKDINLEMRVGGDSLYIPIGSTDSLRIKDFLDTADVDFLQVLADGGYGVRMGDSMSLEVPEIGKEQLKIDDIVESTFERVTLSESLDKIEIPGIRVEHSQSLSFMEGGFPPIAFPNIYKQMTIKSGLYALYPTTPLPPGISIDVPVPPLSAEMKDSLPLNFSQSLPDGLVGLDTVYVKPTQIEIILKKDYFPAGLNLRITTLKLVIPDMIRLGNHPNVNGQVFLLENIDFTDNSLRILIPVRLCDFTPYPLEDGKINIEEKIQMEVGFTMSGTVNSNHFPKTEQTDTRLLVQLNTNMEFDYAVLRVAEMKETLAQQKVPLNISALLDESITHIDAVEVANAKLKLSMQFPALSSSIQWRAHAPEGIQMRFPSFIEFKNTPSFFDATTNTLNIQGEIPSNIELEIARLNINKDLVDGILEVNGELQIRGSIGTTAGRVTTREIELLNNSLFKIGAELPNIEVTGISISGITKNFEDSVVMNIQMDDFPTEVKRLDSIILESADIEMKLKLSKTVFGGKPLQGSLVIDFPDDLMLSGVALTEGNVLRENLRFESGEWKTSFKLKGIKFDGSPLNGQLNLSQKAKILAKLEVLEPNFTAADLTDPIDIEVVFSLKNVEIGKVYGLVELNLDPQKMTVSLSDLPDLLKNENNVLDFDRPFLTLKTKTNVGIPIAADIFISPWKNGELQTQSQQKISLSIPKSESPADVREVHYWIAKDEQGKPSDYVFKGANLGALVKHFPDSIQLEIHTATVGDVQHVFDLKAQYAADVAYDFVLPMAFGDDFSLVLEDTISELDSLFGDMIFSGNEVGLMGEIESSIPLELQLSVIPIDKDFRPIPIDFPKQTIKAGTSTGGSSMSKLDISFSDPDRLMVHLRGFILRFEALSPSIVSGTSIRPENFVKAKIKARLLGGIHIKP